MTDSHNKTENGVLGGNERSDYTCSFRTSDIHQASFKHFLCQMGRSQPNQLLPTSGLVFCFFFRLQLNVKSIAPPETHYLNGSQALGNWVSGFLQRKKIGGYRLLSTGSAQGLCRLPCSLLWFLHILVLFLCIPE